VPLTEEQLAGDLTRAMKARDAVRTSVLRGVITAAKNLKVEKRGAALSEVELVQIVRKEIRKREEAEEFAAKAAREDVVGQNRAEREILEAYAPAPLAAAELEQAIREIVAQPDARNLGAIMQALKTRYAGRYDGKQASDLSRRILAEVASA
jgi:hypothetical protein